MTTHPRSAWGAAPPRASFSPLRGVPYGALHHIGGGSMFPGDIAATLHGIQADLFARGYYDTAYCVGVDHQGDEWTMRGDVRDAATLGYAGISFSILAICNAAAPGFVMPMAMLQGIERAFRNAQARGVLARGAFIEGHHWFDAHVTKYPTSCPSGAEYSIPAIRLGVNAVPDPTPTPGGLMPRFVPPLPVIDGLPAWPRPGAWVLFSDGGVGSFGAPLPHLPIGVNGQPWFIGTPSRIVAPNAAEVNAGKWYVVLNEREQRYAFPLTAGDIEHLTNTHTARLQEYELLPPAVMPTENAHGDTSLPLDPPDEPGGCIAETTT
jgi:hypothetical protein